jgi:hypothetical protein
MKMLGILALTESLEKLGSTEEHGGATEWSGLFCKMFDVQLP